MHRRRFVTTLAAGSLAATAGCLGSLVDRATEHEATPAVVDQDAATDAGYEYRGTEPDVDRQTVAGEEVELTNYGSEYVRQAEVDGYGTIEAGVFGIVSTPQVGVAGQEFNPVAEWDNRKVAERIQSRYKSVSVADKLDERSVEGLETTIDVETFAAEGTHAAHGPLELYLDVGTVDHDGDHLAVLGAYPRDIEVPDDVDLPVEGDDLDSLIRSMESSRVDTMIENVRHDEEEVDGVVEDANQS